MPLQSAATKKLEEKKQKTKIAEQKSVRKLTLRIQLFVLLIVLVLGGTAYYSYTSWNEYSALNNALQTNSSTTSALNGKLTGAQSQFKGFKESFEEKKTTMLKDVDVIFPKSEMMTELTRQLDRFFFNLNSSFPPIIHNNLRFEQPVLSEDESHYILPFSMTIQSSEANFQRFLEYVSNSGSLGSNVRLMDIQSIQLTILKKRENQETETPDINFNVRLHAYFQNNSLTADQK